MRMVRVAALQATPVILDAEACVAKAFEVAGLGWGQAVISLGAVISMTAVLLVFQLGQPRIFYSMSRDGLCRRSPSK